MTRPVSVADHGAHKHDRIAEAAKFIGRGKRRDVFKEIYRHKQRVKTVAEIMAKTGLTRVRILQEGGALVAEGIVHQTKKNGETAYEQDKFYQANKKKILDLNADRKKLASYSTKRGVIAGAAAIPRIIRVSTVGAKIKRVTIDDIGSFSKVKKVEPAGMLGDKLSEDEFKRGIQAIVAEPGQFKDWGGEQSDLYTTRLLMSGRRVGAAFAFKGPALAGKLVPGRMGKNGDQAQRLFREDADIFLVQHCRQIAPSVLDLMKQLAIVQSIATGKQILYGVIDGADSERLRLAYSDVFVAKPKKLKLKRSTPVKRR